MAKKTKNTKDKSAKNSKTSAPKRGSKSAKSKGLGIRVVEDDLPRANRFADAPETVLPTTTSEPVQTAPEFTLPTGASLPVVTPEKFASDCAVSGQRGTVALQAGTAEELQVLIDATSFSGNVNPAVGVGEGYVVVDTSETPVEDPDDSSATLKTFVLMFRYCPRAKKNTKAAKTTAISKIAPTPETVAAANAVAQSFGAESGTPEQTERLLKDIAEADVATTLPKFSETATTEQIVALLDELESRKIIVGGKIAENVRVVQTKFSATRKGLIEGIAPTGIVRYIGNVGGDAGAVARVFDALGVSELIPTKGTVSAQLHRGRKNFQIPTIPLDLAEKIAGVIEPKTSPKSAPPKSGF